jgi:succinate-semialdehyde dehydrogenase/glutarate-semialdehyde dehydrogenase
MPASSDWLTFINPATGQPFGSTPMDSAEKVQQALDEMRAAFPEWSRKTLAERCAVLRKFQKLLIDSADEITAVINPDCGKPARTR